MLWFSLACHELGVHVVCPTNHHCTPPGLGGRVVVSSNVGTGRDRADMGRHLGLAYREQAQSPAREYPPPQQLEHASGNVDIPFAWVDAFGLG